MIKWILTTFIILTICRIGLSQIESEMVFQINRQYSKVDRLPSLHDFHYSFTPGVLYSGELSAFITKKN